MTTSVSDPSPSSSIRLSICIATFNRAKFIAETLDSILTQIEPGLEIVILDGGSSDGTDRIVEPYAARHGNVRYIRHSSNAGVDQDFNSVVEQAAGQYCWLMSDDDLLVPGAIATVLKALEGEPSLVIVNAEVRSADMSQVLRRSQLSFAEDRAYAPSEMDRLFVDAGDYLTFIACVIIRRQVWLERERALYYGTLFIHVGVIFQKALPGLTRVLARPLISIRYGNAMWRPKEFEIWMFKWPLLIWSLAGLSDSARVRSCIREPWRRASRLFLYRAKGTYSLNEYRQWIGPRLKSVSGRAVARTVAIIPGFLANAVMIWYYRLRRSEGGMGMLDMRNSRFHIRNWLGRRGS